MKYIKTFEDFVKPEGNEITEMGLGDWKVKAVLAAYNKADSKGKSKMSKTITGDKDANLAEITKQLRSLDKDEIDELTTDLGLDETVKESIDPMIWYYLGQQSQSGSSDPVSMGTAVAIIAGALLTVGAGVVAAKWDDIKASFAGWKKQRRLDKVDKDFSEDDLKQILMQLQSTHSDVYQLIKSNKAADQIADRLKDTDIKDEIDPKYMTEFIKRLKEVSRKK